MKKITRNGTNGLVYGGDVDLVHIQDGKRASMGSLLALILDANMRAYDKAAERHDADTPLCPGCAMLAIYNAAVAMADSNGYDRRQLAANMMNLFYDLAFDPEIGQREELKVIA
mgnify:CR=1 FL=1